MIAAWPDALDFENFEEVYDNLDAIRRHLDEEQTDESDLCVDITGGQKPTSAAAGLFTANKDVVVQYVQTNKPKKALTYDVRWFDWPKGTD